jgi:peptidoglycan/xylan/chitin deacetylase (PgdA/CDA1 family)
MTLVRSLTLMYHAVSDGLDDALAVRVADFERQLADFSTAGFRGATATQILERPGDRRLLHLTFDDAYASVRNALPALRRHRVPATVFVCTNLADGGKPLAIPELDRVASRDELRTLTWDELRELVSDDLVEVGSHTTSHAHLTQLSDAELGRELRDSRVAIGDNLGRPPDFLAYPFGEEDRRVRRATRAAGYTAAFAVPGTSIRLDPFRLPRTGLWRDEPADRQRFKTRFGVRLGTQAARNASAMRARARLR